VLSVREEKKERKNGKGGEGILVCALLYFPALGEKKGGPRGRMLSPFNTPEKGERKKGKPLFTCLLAFIFSNGGGGRERREIREEEEGGVTFLSFNPLFTSINISIKKKRGRKKVHEGGGERSERKRPTAAGCPFVAHAKPFEKCKRKRGRERVTRGKKKEGKSRQSCSSLP